MILLQHLLLILSRSIKGRDKKAVRLTNRINDH